jgi:hypothetical protein
VVLLPDCCFAAEAEFTKLAEWPGADMQAGLVRPFLALSFITEIA